MTTIAAPPRRARTTSRAPLTRAPARGRQLAPSPRTKSASAKSASAKSASAKGRARRHASESTGLGRLGAVLVLVTVGALVTAVVFHVMLAQHQMELDNLNARIATEQRVYEHRRLQASQLAAPQRIIQEAERLGLVVPAEPAEYLPVVGAPPLSHTDGSTADTLADYAKTKQSLAGQEP